MCCHLRLNLDELQKKGGGGLFGSGVKTGSIGVVSVDMARLGFLHKNDEDALLGHLEEIIGEASKSLEIKRKLLKKNLDRGLMPWTQKYLGSFDHHFSTIGPIGMHECCLNMFGEGIQSDNGLKFALKVLKFMRQKLLDFQESTGHLYNLEEIPAEGASHRLAVIDRNSCRGIKLSGERQSPYLTNSTHLPVDLYDDPWKAIKHQEQLQQLYSGGSAFHLLLGQSVSPKTVKSLVSKICQNSKIPYLSITPTFSVCPQCGYIAGTHEVCPTCGREADVYSRVVGYLRPVKSWNEGKKQEFAERKTFIINADLEEKNEELNELQGDW
jgi:ribonucleoside-triphosphate reductase